MEFITAKECPLLEPYSFSNHHPSIHLKTSEITCAFGANSEKEFKAIISIMPDNTRTVVLYNLEGYLVFKYNETAYLVCKIIDI